MDMERLVLSTLYLDVRIVEPRRHEISSEPNSFGNPDRHFETVLGGFVPFQAFFGDPLEPHVLHCLHALLAAIEPILDVS